MELSVCPKGMMEPPGSLGMLQVQGQGALGSVWAARNPPQQIQLCLPCSILQMGRFHFSFSSLMDFQVSQLSPVLAEC